MKDRRITALREYIIENIQQEFSLDDLAAQVELSKSRLTELFTNQTGRSPIRYILEVRLEEAKKLLENEAGKFLHINEVAWRVGYRDLPNFIREFKKTYSAPPKKYRENFWSEEDSASKDEK